jgi:hypothetical protein
MYLGKNSITFFVILVATNHLAAKAVEPQQATLPKPHIPRIHIPRIHIPAYPRLHQHEKIISMFARRSTCPVRLNQPRHPNPRYFQIASTSDWRAATYSAGVVETPNVMGPYHHTRDPVASSSDCCGKNRQPIL